MTARFCIAEVGLPFAPGIDVAAVEEALESLLDLISACKDEGQEVCRSSALESQDITHGVSLAEYMYELGRLDRVLQGALQQAINRCRHWDGDLEEPLNEESSQVEIGGMHYAAPSVAWAHQQQRDRHAVACLRIGPQLDGPQTVRVNERTTTLYFLSRCDETQRCAFYRTIPSTEDLDEQGYLAVAHLLFPSLHFKPGIEQEFRRFAGGYRAVRDEVTHHLAAVNDHFRRLFEQHGGQVETVAKALQSISGVVMSGESPGTKANRDAWKQRKINIDKQEVICELHLKLSPTKNRIHFHPGKPGIAGGKIIIGIFHEHLTT